MTKIRKTDESTAYQIVYDLTPSPTDVDGSYTGKPKGNFEVPVQDADDL